MIRLSRRPSHGRRQAFSLVAAVRVASAIPKHTVAVARPMYGVSPDERAVCTDLQKSWEIHMDLLRRSSIRKPAVWLATFLSVAAPSFAFAQDPVSAQPKRPPDANEQQFMFDNDLAMSNMSRTMLVNPTGDIDRDFVALMVPQHQQVILFRNRECSASYCVHSPGFCASNTQA
jgi:hypothetical protein